MSPDKPLRAAIWAGVSTDDQDTDNQLEALLRFAKNRGLVVTDDRWVLEESAWNGKHRRALDQALAAATLGEFDVLLVWALDRLTREGGEAMLRELRRFREHGVMVWALQDSWTMQSSDPIVYELLVGIFGTLARAESARRSARVRQSIEARKAAGTWTGRGKDQGKRSTGAYAQAAREREAKKRANAKAPKVLDGTKKAV